MTAHTYLSQLKGIDRRITDKLEEAVRWYDQATTISAPQGNPNKVMTSKKKDPMGDAISLYVDASNEANDLAYKLATLKKKIIKQIDSLENPTYYAIIKGYYLNNKPMTLIADEEHYSVTQIRRLYKESLREFDKKYGAEYGK